jgi:hypothetical protein
MDRLLVFIAASAIARHEESAELADVFNAVAVRTDSSGQRVLGRVENRHRAVARLDVRKGCCTTLTLGRQGEGVGKVMEAAAIADVPKLADACTRRVGEERKRPTCGLGASAAHVRSVKEGGCLLREPGQWQSAALRGHGGG